MNETPEDHEPELDRPPLTTSTTLWCQRCKAATAHRVAHLASAEMGAPRCVVCSLWVGFRCVVCRASGEDRRRPAPGRVI